MKYSFDKNLKKPDNFGGVVAAADGPVATNDRLARPSIRQQFALVYAFICRVNNFSNLLFAIDF